MNYTYCGIQVPRFLPKEIYEGYRDRNNFRLADNLYRYPTWKKVLWWLGWIAADISRSGKP